MMSNFGKCNVCASPCTSCVRLGPELLPSGSTSNFSSDETCEHKVACVRISQTAAASSPASCCLADYHSEVDDESHCSDSSKNLRNKVSGGILPCSVKSESNELSSVNDFHAGPTSVKGHLHSCSIGHTGSSSSIIMERAANEDSKQDVADSAKTIKVEFAEDIATKSLNSSNDSKNLISFEQANVDKPCQLSEFVRSDDESALLDDNGYFVKQKESQVLLDSAFHVMYIMRKRIYPLYSN